MNSDTQETPQKPGIMGESVLAIISVALAAFWIAFAYYQGGSVDGNGNKIMLLHPLVPIALIGLLIRIYRWVGIKFVVQLEIIMIGLWLFLRMLGVLMPFVLGFGFAYLFRFLWNALPFKKYYQRAIATALIVLICSGVLILTGFRVANQVSQMTKGIQIYFHETLLPWAVGEKFTALAVDIEDKIETCYIGTNHGIYFIQRDIDEPHKDSEEINLIGITNGELVGKGITAIAVGEKYIYAGTVGGLYRCNKKIVKVTTGEIETSLISLSDDLKWTKVGITEFDNLSINSIDLPPWDPTLIYIGTEEKWVYQGKFSNIDDNTGIWKKEKIDNSENRSIISIHSIDKYDETRKKLITYVASKIKDEDENNNNEGKGQNNNNEDTEQYQYQVHFKPSHSITWSLLDTEGSEVPKIQKIVASNRDDVQLLAGTLEGLYERGIYKYEDWKETTDKASVPNKITLLQTNHSGKYAGNGEIIYYKPKGETKWKDVVEKEPGVYKYKDSPIGKHFENYLTEKIPGWTKGGGTFVKWLSGLAGSIAFQFGGLIATIFLAFIVFVYATQGLDKYFIGFINLIPEKHRQTTKAYLTEIDTNMHQFLKGQLTVIVIVSIISCIVYRLIGVPFALLIGILAGFCNAIPTFGPFIGGGFAYIAMLMGLAAGEYSSIIEFLVRCVFVLAAILGIQTIDNSLISPKVMSSAIDVDPLLIMFAVLVGASILGFWGVLLAIPIIVVIKSIVTISKSTTNEVDQQNIQEQP